MKMVLVYLILTSLLVLSVECMDKIGNKLAEAINQYSLVLTNVTIAGTENMINELFDDLLKSYETRAEILENIKLLGTRYSKTNRAAKLTIHQAENAISSFLLWAPHLKTALTSNEKAAGIILNKIHEDIATLESSILFHISEFNSILNETENFEVTASKLQESAEWKAKFIHSECKKYDENDNRKCIHKEGTVLAGLAGLSMLSGLSTSAVAGVCAFVGGPAGAGLVAVSAGAASIFPFLMFYTADVYQSLGRDYELLRATLKTITEILTLQLENAQKLKVEFASFKGNENMFNQMKGESLPEPFIETAINEAIKTMEKAQKYAHNYNENVVQESQFLN